MILAIETSCDETAAALISDQGVLIQSTVASQIALHAPYGGVVPELASRNHSKDLPSLVEACLSEAGVSVADLSAVAATSGPGLSSSLLVGDTFAKALALARGLPFNSINHMEGHLVSPFLPFGSDPIPAHLALIVSGGHSLLIHVREIGDYEILGTTQDDAAGEAFDKVAKLMGLPYPGGPEIAAHAERGDPKAFDFPRSMVGRPDLMFSFSGLKTSARYQLEKLPQPLDETMRDDFCAAFQEAIVDILCAKVAQAAEMIDCGMVAVSGGVACNRRLRERLTQQEEQADRRLLLVDGKFSTDNAAMIAYAAYRRRLAGIAPSSLHQDINPSWSLAEPIS